MTGPAAAAIGERKATMTPSSATTAAQAPRKRPQRRRRNNPTEAGTPAKAAMSNKRQPSTQVGGGPSRGRFTLNGRSKGNTVVTATRATAKRIEKRNNVIMSANA